MAIEIERKFLLVNADWRAETEASVAHYRQGYLALSAQAVVRVRMGDDDAAWLCVKERKVGAARGEYEYAIPVEDARDLLGLAMGEVVAKHRHVIHHAGHTWEVDEFGGANAGLVIAEIELPHAEEAFPRPSWLGAEVTDDERYYNAYLALHPWREWRATGGD